MHILNIIQCTNLGGMEQASLRLMKSLQSRGHEISLVSLNPIAQLGPLLDEAGIPSMGLDYSARSKSSAWLALKRTFATLQADALIMTGHNFAASLALGRLCEGRRLLAVHFHHEGVMPKWRWRLIYRAAMVNFQSVTFPSCFVRQEAEAIYPPIGSIAETVRNPLEIPAGPSPILRQEFRAQIGVPAEAPLVGNAGWLVERKRFDVFLHAAVKILEQRPETYFVIAGDGELRGPLQELASSLGLGARLSWTGWLKDLKPFYASIDALLFNSDWDAFPTTPIEAMSHGVPVVASIGRGGLGEILDNSCGWLMNHHDTEALASAVDAALSPEGEARAATARRRVASFCDPAAIAEQIETRLSGQACAYAA